MKSSYSYRCDSSNIAILQHTNYHGNGRIITNIMVPTQFRKKGYGSFLLNEICRDADINKVALWLEVQYKGGLSKNQLIWWFMRHGFVDAGGIFVRRFKK